MIIRLICDKGKCATNNYEQLFGKASPSRKMQIVIFLCLHSFQYSKQLKKLRRQFFTTGSLCNLHQTANTLVSPCCFDIRLLKDVSGSRSVTPAAATPVKWGSRHDFRCCSSPKLKSAASKCSVSRLENESQKASFQIVRN